MGLAQKPPVTGQTNEVTPFPGSLKAFLDSTEVAPSHRLQYWKSNVDKHNGLDIVCATSNFIGRMTTRKLGLCAVHGVQIDTPHKAVRVRSDEDLCFANIQLADAGAHFSGSREFDIPRGSMVLYEASEPYELGFSGESRSLVLALPKSELEKRVANLQMHLDQAITYDSHKIAMLAGLMQGVLALPEQVRLAVSDSVAESVVNMLAATLFDCDDVQTETQTFGVSALLQRIKAYVNANIQDPDLNPVVIAEAMGITVSYLHKVFLQNNNTVMQYVLAERLERCRRDIAKTDRAGGISQVAYNWGFNDASHFSRSFRKRFGVSPREYRAQVVERNARLVAQ